MPSEKTNGNGGLSTAFKALFIAASFVSVGWVLDGRIENKIETLRVEQKEQAKNIETTNLILARIDERLKTFERKQGE